MADVFDLVESGKIKRYFATRNKHCFEGAISHITQRAPGAEPLFLEESDYLYMIHLIKESSNKFNFRVFSFALMQNHIHLLVKFSESNMIDAMKELFRIYALYFNKKYARKGHVFCGAYRSALCFDDNYLLAASLYIHLNPVKAGLVKNWIDYRWSSCALFANEIKKETFVDYKFILGILDRDMALARKKYENFIHRFDTNQISSVFENRNTLQIIVQMIEERSGKCSAGYELLGDEDLKRKIEELNDKGHLKGPSERSARKFLIDQLRARGFNIAEIAKKLNLTRATVYSYLKA